MPDIPVSTTPPGAPPQELTTVRNRTFDEIAVGDTDAI